MMEYILEDKKFSVSYRELKELYHNFKDMSDEEFDKNILDVLHFSCIVCYFKEIPTYICLSDIGIVHEISHYMVDKDIIKLKDLRKLFNEQLKLS